MGIKKINWNNFNNDKEILDYLGALPRYKNTNLKSLFYRGLFFLDLVFCRLFNKIKPLFVVLVTNNGCNLNCVYCYGSYGEKVQKDYTTKELLEVIDSLKELGTRLIHMHGGEALLRQDIEEIFNYAKLKGFYISYNGNGFMVPQKIESIKKLDAFCISLDGKEENHDKNRGEGSYKIAMTAIELLKKHNLPVVIQATLTKDNYNDMEYMAELALKKDLRLQCSILYNSEALKDKISDIILSDAEIRQVIKKFVELKKKNYPVYFSENVLNTAVEWPFKYGEKNFITIDDEYKNNSNLTSCYHGKLKFFIDGDGRVITCWDHNYENAPNWKDVGLKKAVEICHKNDKCRHCAFLANNEHNSLLGLNFMTFLNVLKIQLTDTFKIGKMK